MHAMKHSITCIVVSALVLWTTATMADSGPMNERTPKQAWLETAVFYQIYPQSFCDSNGDGIGDLPGIIAKLDYIRSLGCNAIWLNPVFESPFKDAGYDVTDFRKVAPRYGTNADLKNLFQEAHRRGMHVILDLVAGHTSDQHPWFKQSAQAKPNRFSDYYIWTDSAWTTFGDPHLLPGYERDGCYLPNFFPSQPALNYGYANPDLKKPWQQPMSAPGPRAVLKELMDNMAFWLDAGCDGFRVDMASSLVKEDLDGRGIRKLWSEVREWLDKAYPEAVLVSEWSNPTKAIAAGFNVDFMLHFGEPAYKYLCAPHVNPQTGSEFGFFSRKGDGDITLFLDNYLKNYQATREQGYIALPTGNHDFARFRHRRSEGVLRVFLAMLLTMPGVPFIYYGDEIGMDFREGLVSKEGGYSRTGTRTPMQWDSSKGAGFSTADPKDFYLPIDPDSRRPNVQAQESDPNSVLNLTRKLLSLRRANASLGNLGGFKPLYAEAHKYPFVYRRTGGPDDFVVAINPTDSKQTCEVAALQRAQAILGGEHIKLDGQRLVMSPISYAVFKVSKK